MERKQTYERLRLSAVTDCMLQIMLRHRASWPTKDDTEVVQPIKTTCADGIVESVARGGLKTKVT